MPVDDLAAARTAIRDRRLSDLLGVPECGWLDVRNGIYELDNPAKSEELAKDVAGFANSPSGGLLLVGFSTQVDLDRHRKLIRERVIPPPRGVIVNRAGPIAMYGPGARGHGHTGALTEEEFEHQKARLLAQSPPNGST